MDGINLCYGSYTHGKQLSQWTEHTLTCRATQQAAQHIIRCRYMEKKIFLFCPFPPFLLHTGGTRQNRAALPYRQWSLLSHLLLFISLTMLSFGCSNHGDAFAQCVCTCEHEKTSWVAFVKRRHQKGSHTHPAQHKALSTWLNWALNNQNSLLTFPGLWLNRLHHSQTNTESAHRQRNTETNYLIMSVSTRDEPTVYLQA